ncbi:MAG: hypothetical protein E6J82_06635 [Deltaproteobacteria bacterium]|nr:MAG: hypothetical protein E6J82_06635 [Deltaproteobacteria bacterium]
MPRSTVGFCSAEIAIDATAGPGVHATEGRYLVQVPSAPSANDSFTPCSGWKANTCFGFRGSTATLKTPLPSALTTSRASSIIQSFPAFVLR